MLRALVLGCLASATFAGPAVASPGPVRVDRDHGVRFELSGPNLTVTLIRPDVQDDVWGKNLDAICSPAFDPRRASRTAVRAVQLWPQGQTELTFTFDRDISYRVKWCLLEDGAHDIAGVNFQPFFPVYGTSANDKRIARELRRYLWRNAGFEPWIWRLSGIVVDHKVIAVATDLRRSRRSRRIARVICRLIQGADVADFTPGHTVVGRGDVVLRACRARPPID
jgi:hypothetical protein